MKEVGGKRGELAGVDLPLAAGGELNLCLSTFESSPLVIPCALASFLELMVIHSQEEQRKYVYTIFSRLESLGDYFHCNYINKRIKIFMILNLPFQTHGSRFVQ